MKLRKIFIVLFSILAVACSKKLDDGSASLTLKATEADYKPSNQYLTVRASGDWNLTMTFSDQKDLDFRPWAYFGKYTDVDSIRLSGSGNSDFIQFNWTGNNSPDTRIATITITCGSSSQSYTFTQSGKSQGSDTAKVLKSDILGNWMELPQTNTPGLYFYSHPMTVGGNTTRNYTYGWDSVNLVALWVAYPLNSATIGSGSRTNEWGLDPKVPRQYQPILFHGFSSSLGFIARGHQCPSADRLTYENNVKTFYFTNMTPQRNELNSAAWGVLEGMVRSWCRSFDTLYVVTGCIVDGSTEKAYDNEGKAVTVPTGYYKALMGYKKSGTVADTGDNGGYTAIAFYFDHKSYSGKTTTVMQQSITVDSLETITGINFFYKLEKDNPTISSRVEKSINSWWSKNI